MAAGEADCVSFILWSGKGGFGACVADREFRSTVTKDAQGNEHLMIQFNVSLSGEAVYEDCG